MPSPALRRATSVAVLAAALSAAGCGQSNADKKTSSAAKRANGTDLAFVDGMIRHHQSAIDMAELAQVNGEHEEVSDLGARIMDVQMDEIETMRRLGQRFVDRGIRPRPLGMSNSDTGMNMGIAALKKAKNFDMRFIAVMTKHHGGAVAMSRVELARGINPQVKSIAKRIIRDQQREIDDMTTWSLAWYGTPSAGASGDDMGTGA